MYTAWLKGCLIAQALLHAGAPTDRDDHRRRRVVDYDHVARTEEALALQPDIIATGCPFCNTMLTDGTKHFQQEGKVEVLDVAELIARADDLV